MTTTLLALLSGILSGTTSVSLSHARAEPTGNPAMARSRTESAKEGKGPGSELPLLIVNDLEVAKDKLEMTDVFNRDASIFKHVRHDC